MARVSRMQIRRRRSFVAVVGFAALVLAVALRPGRGATGTTSASGSSHPSLAASPPARGLAPASDPVPAWLAWIPGGFPDGFRAQIAHAADLGTTVVVAGDTLWMTVSHDGSGAIVDRPPPPYKIPLDAFAVDPQGYAPFLPPGDRDRIVSALREGKAVLGQRSAERRGLGPGGSISFGATTVTIGAVAPDAEVGWSEILVNRGVGARLGISHDRYLLALGAPGLTVHRFGAVVRRSIPSDSPLRTVPPGGTPFVRVASGVDPPSVMKEAFGEFAAYPRSDDPAYLVVDPAWYHAHIVTRTVPIFPEPVTCNRALFPMLIGALQDVQAAGLASEIHVYSGCYAARTVARSTIAPPSQHAYGAAIDINAPENPYGARPVMDPRIVRIFERWGFNWGGDFLIPDGMHFEYGKPPAA
jgi:D-alanyl-D-alanine carboxypeptidase-like protein